MATLFYLLHVLSGFRREASAWHAYQCYTHFIKKYPTVEDDCLTTSGTNKAVDKPMTLGTNHPFINKYVGISDPESGVPFVSSATVFVSHAWRYEFHNVVVTVMEYMPVSTLTRISGLIYSQMINTKSPIKTLSGSATLFGMESRA